MKFPKGYSLKELSVLTGIEIRTIRSYIEQGLIRGPEALGRNAYYTEHHRRRLERIKLLRDIYGMPLSEIRRSLLTAREDDFEEDSRKPPRQETPGQRAGEPAATYCPSVRDRQRWMRKAMQQGPEAPACPMPPSPELAGATLRSELEPGTPISPCAAPPPDAPLTRVVQAIEKMLGPRRVARNARAVSITRIEITPDIALELKGEYTPVARALFERLADCLRDAFVHGTEEGTENKPG
ncbi:MAG: MerR family transcriptional regulator [Candidatus Hydrogenedentes bacterium]|nr:MerR family transcriptional regulator [Candidatus Hydrogenedentota bacterium]